MLIIHLNAIVPVVKGATCVATQPIEKKTVSTILLTHYTGDSVQSIIIISLRSCEPNATYGSLEYDRLHGIWKDTQLGNNQMTPELETGVITVVYSLQLTLGQFSRVDRCSHKVYYKLATLLSTKFTYIYVYT